MIRKSFKMNLNAGQEEEYQRRHNPIWDDLSELLRQHGVHNYSIFHDPKTDSLFAYAEIEDEERWQTIANDPICKKWWEHMADLMATNEDDSPKAQDLREVFHMD